MRQDGWAVQIHYTEGDNPWGVWLNFHHVQYPFMPTPLIDAWDTRLKRNWGFDLTTNFDRSASARCYRSGITTPYQLDHDFMPLYRMLQRTRIDGGPAEPIIDWLLELDVPFITEFLSAN